MLRNILVVLSSEASLDSCVGHGPLEELLLRVHQDVLVPGHDLHALPYQPDVGGGGGGDHRHGELDLLLPLVVVEVGVPHAGVALVLL